MSRPERLAELLVADLDDDGELPRCGAAVGPHHVRGRSERPSGTPWVRTKLAATLEQEKVLAGSHDETMIRALFDGLPWDALLVADDAWMHDTLVALIPSPSSKRPTSGSWRSVDPTRSSNTAMALFPCAATFDLPAFVVLDSMPDQRFLGSVSKVAPLPDSSSRWGNPDLKLYATEVLITDKLPDVKPGVSARAEVLITNLPDVLSVPIQAVTTHKGKPVVFLASAPQEPVPVTVGQYNTKFIQICSGLREGDQVLLAPPFDTKEKDLGGAIIADDEALPAGATNHQRKCPGPRWTEERGRRAARRCVRFRPGRMRPRLAARAREGKRSSQRPPFREGAGRRKFHQPGRYDEAVRRGRRRAVERGGAGRAATLHRAAAPASVRVGRSPDRTR